MDIFRLYIDDYNLKADFNLCFIFIIVIGIVIWFCWSYKKFRLSYEIDEAEVGIGNQKLKVKPNRVDAQIAYKIWVELSTRKIGLPIDFENDVIIEIYDSWHEFFRVTRELIKEIPVSKARNSKNTKIIINLAMEVLNEGLRPHLTQWQAKFRRWYNYQIQIGSNNDKTPQELQKMYPSYEEMTEHMKVVNTKLIAYRNAMRMISID